MVVLDWVFRRIFSPKRVDVLAQKVLNSALDFMQTPEFQKEAQTVINPLFDYYKAKAFSTIGGIMKGANAAIPSNPMDILGAGGKLDWKTLVMGFLSNRMTQGQNQPQTSLP